MPSSLKNMALSCESQFWPVCTITRSPSLSSRAITLDSLISSGRVPTTVKTFMLTTVQVCRPSSGKTVCTYSLLVKAGNGSFAVGASQMHLGIYSQWYDPEPGPASLPGIYARQLASRGHQVEVLTGFPNYPTGKLHAGYGGRRPITETRDGIPVHRVPLVPSHSGSTIGRVANYTSFAASASLLGSHLLNYVDALWVYNSPATVGIPLVLRRRKSARPFLLHVQDLWPESALNSGMIPPGRLASGAEWLLRKLVDHIEAAATEIAVISPSVLEALVERGVPRERISYVPNPTDEVLFQPRARNSSVRRRLAPEGDVVFMYAGSLGHVQALDRIIDAMPLVRNHRNIKLVFVGSGVAEASLREQAAHLELTSVEFLGRVTPNEIPDLLAAADVQIVSLRDDPFLAMTIPSKLQAILASAQPILGVLSGDGAALVRQAGAGVVCHAGSPGDIAAAMIDLAGQGSEARQRLGQSGYDHYQRHMSASMAGEAVEKLLIRMVEGG